MICVVPPVVQLLGGAGVAVTVVLLRKPNEINHHWREGPQNGEKARPELQGNSCQPAFRLSLVSSGTKTSFFLSSAGRHKSFGCRHLSPRYAVSQLHRAALFTGNDSSVLPLHKLHHKLQWTSTFCIARRASVDPLPLYCFGF
eukprot:jgi/Mesen1/9442/ME000626S08704